MDERESIFRFTLNAVHDYRFRGPVQQGSVRIIQTESPEAMHFALEAFTKNGVRLIQRLPDIATEVIERSGTQELIHILSLHVTDALRGIDATARLLGEHPNDCRCAQCLANFMAEQKRAAQAFKR